MVNENTSMHTFLSNLGLYNYYRVINKCVFILSRRNDKRPTWNKSILNHMNNLIVLYNVGQITGLLSSFRIVRFF